MVHLTRNQIKETKSKTAEAVVAHSITNFRYRFTPLNLLILKLNFSWSKQRPSHRVPLASRRVIELNEYIRRAIYQNIHISKWPVRPLSTL